MAEGGLEVSLDPAVRAEELLEYGRLPEGGGGANEEEDGCGGRVAGDGVGVVASASAEAEAEATAAAEAEGGSCGRFAAPAENSIMISFMHATRKCHLRK